MQDDFEAVGSIKVKDGLYMGDEYSAQDIDQLTMNKIGYVLNCAGKDSYNYWESDGIVYLTVNWSDSDQQVLFEPKSNLINQIFEFIEIALSKGESVLVHSLKGQNRCTCAIVGYLMKKYRWSLRKSLEYIRSKRPNLPLRPSFFNQLLSLENKLFQMALEGRTDSWNEVSDIPGSDELVVTHTFLNTKILGMERSLSDTSTAKSSKQSRISWAEQMTSAIEIECHSENSDEDEESEEDEVQEEEEIESKTSLNGLCPESEQGALSLNWAVKSNSEPISSKSILKSESRFASPTLTIRKVTSVSASVPNVNADRESSRAESSKQKVIRKPRPSSSTSHTRTTQASKARVSSATRKEEKPVVPENMSNNSGNVINITINNFISDANAPMANGSKQLPGRKLTINSKMMKKSNTSSSSTTNLDLLSLFAKGEFVNTINSEQSQLKVTPQKRPFSTSSGQDREMDGWNRTPIVMDTTQPLSITGLSTGKYKHQTFNSSAPNFRKAIEVPIKSFATSQIPASSSFTNSLAGLYQQRPSNYAHQGRFLPIKVVSTAKFFESTNVINNARSNKVFKRPASAAVSSNSLKNPLESPYYHPSNNSLRIKKAKENKSENQSKVRMMHSKQDGAKNVVIRSKLRSPSPAEIKYYSANQFFAGSN